ncbi:MAG TPA: class I SAM-dependent methyltransferase [Stellaceae bacterium]|jgi:SAM-dependent methyltransferase|nr:class I SAM-dependent methyltransferase [Stellaceae bacterium]
MATEQQVTQHYGSLGIAERVLAALHEAKGPDIPVTPETLAPFDQFHGRGVVATKELVALLKPLAGERLLDIGSGIAGPARWIAAKFGCHVTGVDLTPEFCAAAEALNAAAGMGDRVTIRNGSALDLPVPDGAFDAAYSQNVIMNIADKRRFYREAFRALRPGGRLALSNLCAGVNGDPFYPVPWAMSPATSFLATADEMRADLVAAGFAIAHFEDTTAATVEMQRRARERVERGEKLRIAVQIIMGERAREMQINTSRNVEEGRVATIEALVTKPV